MVAVAEATATKTAAVGAATTVAGTPTTAPGVPTSAPGIGADGIAFTTAASTATTAASMARSPWHFVRGVAHIAHYFPPLLEEAHAPHSQLEAEEEKAMIRGLWVLVVTVVWGVVHAGFVCAVCPCCFVRLTWISAPKNQQTTAY
jgi:hypothetical protein